jgi:hypothetical protein
VRDALRLDRLLNATRPRRSPLGPSQFALSFPLLRASPNPWLYSTEMRRGRDPKARAAAASRSINDHRRKRRGSYFLPGFFFPAMGRLCPLCVRAFV